MASLSARATHPLARGSSPRCAYTWDTVLAGTLALAPPQNQHHHQQTHQHPPNHPLTYSLTHSPTHPLIRLRQGTGGLVPAYLRTDDPVKHWHLSLRETETCIREINAKKREAEIKAQEKSKEEVPLDPIPLNEFLYDHLKK